MVLLVVLSEALVGVAEIVHTGGCPLVAVAYLAADGERGGVLLDGLVVLSEALIGEANVAEVTALALERPTCVDGVAMLMFRPLRRCCSLKLRVLCS